MLVIDQSHCIYLLIRCDKPESLCDLFRGSTTSYIKKVSWHTSMWLYYEGGGGGDIC